MHLGLHLHFLFDMSRKIFVVLIELLLGPCVFFFDLLVFL
jgi:hypothetical protein